MENLKNPTWVASKQTSALLIMESLKNPTWVASKQESALLIMESLKKNINKKVILGKRKNKKVKKV